MIDKADPFVVAIQTTFQDRFPGATIAPQEDERVVERRLQDLPVARAPWSSSALRVHRLGWTVFPQTRDERRAPGSPYGHMVRHGVWQERKQTLTDVADMLGDSRIANHNVAIALGDVNEKMLGFWLQQRYLDAKTESTLRQVLNLRDEAARLDQAIDRLSEEREQIDRDQKRIRENLQALGDRSSEKELRERYVRTLQGQEDRLEEIERAYKEHNTARVECREKISDILGKIDYEATL